MGIVASRRESSYSWFGHPGGGAASANLFLDGLLGDERRKTGWMRAEAAGDPDPGGNRLFWAGGAGTRMGFATLCGSMLSRTSPHRRRFWSLMRPDFSRRARHPVVFRVNTPARQARSRARLVCSPPMCWHGVTPLSIARSFYPGVGRAPRQGWPPPIPETITFANKPALAADAVYSVGDIEGALRRACKGYVLGVKSDHYFGSWAGKPMASGKAEEIARDLAPDAW